MEWIKINDDESNLPEVSCELLITDNHGEVSITFYDSEKKSFDIEENIFEFPYFVIAYMYLAKPFKE